MSSKSQPKRVSMLSSEIRTKLKRKTLVKTNRTSSNFFSNIDLEQEETEDDDFNKTLNRIIEKNITFWVKIFKNYHLFLYFYLIGTLYKTKEKC